MGKKSGSQKGPYKLFVRQEFFSPLFNKRQCEIGISFLAKLL